jgi:hypothetical protein
MIFDVIYSILKVSIAFGQVSPQEMLNKALAFPKHRLNKTLLDDLRVESFRIFWLSVNDFAIDVHGIFVLEGREPCKHFVDQDTKSPPIDWLPVTLIEQNLRRYVFRSTTNGKGALRDNLGEAKINHLEVAVISDHDVFWLQISVYDILSMQVLKNTDDLCPVELCLPQIEVLHGPVVGEQVTSSEELCNEVYVAIVLEEAIVVHLKKNIYE